MSHFPHHSDVNQRYSGACLTLAAGAMAVAACAMSSSPLARADTADLPIFPDTIGSLMNEESIGIPPLFDGSAYQVEGSYTDLLGDYTTVEDPSAGLTLNYDSYSFPGTGDPSLVGEEFTDPFQAGTLANGEVGGSTFGLVGTTSGWINLYEDTPYEPFNAPTVDNVDDVLAYEPSGLSDTASAIDFGIQYLDLPDAATPVDEINFLGSGGDILFSIPVTGDLFSLF
jgi:hypothetical protein